MTNLHPLDKGFMMRKTGVWWTPDKSADDDGIPVNDVIVSVLFRFHCIENRRSVLDEIPFVYGW